ncbi:MAG: glycoside hydrolase family protein [Verrucomicrobiae bacterium]|nr:glycoside hydrolase family protein [Verrucomicrobiae bacterium]NNJ42200.1 hypothetical protein [Akkermansiaceae bacterium]
MKLIHLILTLALSLSCTFAGEDQTRKKGVCLGKKSNSSQQLKKKIQSMNPGWHYNWTGAWKETKIKDASFVPMVWGKSKWALAPLKSHRVSKSKMATSPLLGFNEPDGKKQANMSVQEAIDLWPMLEKTNRRLGSPATVHADNDWMQSFMKQANHKNLRVDFVCVHWYGGNNPAGLIRYLKRIHTLYQKPLWITEFAIADWSAKSLKGNKHSPEDALHFMKAVLPKLEQLEFVERYAWFSGSPDHAKLGPSALFDHDGSPTKLGEFYAAYGN